MFPPLAFPLTVLWTLRPEHTWVFNSPGHSREPTLPPSEHKPQRKSLSKGKSDQNCVVYRFLRRVVCHNFWEGARSDWGVGLVCSQVLVVRKSLKCSKCGSQVRMVRNMPVIIIFFFFSPLFHVYFNVTCFYVFCWIFLPPPHFFFILMSCQFEP